MTYTTQSIIFKTLIMYIDLHLHQLSLLIVQYNQYFTPINSLLSEPEISDH